MLMHFIKTGCPLLIEVTVLKTYCIWLINRMHRKNGQFASSKECDSSAAENWDSSNGAACSESKWVLSDDLFSIIYQKLVHFCANMFVILSVLCCQVNVNVSIVEQVKSPLLQCGGDQLVQDLSAMLADWCGQIR